MKTWGKGLVVVLMTILLFGLLVPHARAGTERELRKLLEGKQVVYQGTCHLNEAGMFRDKEETYLVRRCLIGVDYGEPDEIYYALIYENGEAVKLIRINKDAGNKQDVLWTNKKEV